MDRVMRLAIGSVVVGLGVLALKLVAWRVTGSVALLSDALESVVNVATALAVIVALRVARRPADANHPFGHHKAEFFSAVLEGVLIVLAALFILREAWDGFASPRALDAPGLGLAVNAAAGVLNAGWAWLLIREGRRHRSPALAADGRHLMTDVVSSLGVLIGAIPGTGATAAAFISYSDARRRSPNKENFGKGEIEGVAASEAGNNGVAGATLIPLLSLGIPGDVITAIILGAFMIHGLSPGPVLFQENLPLIYALFMGIMLSALILCVVGNAAIRYFSMIADIPKAILLPIVPMFCVYGAYAVNNSTFDIGLMLVFGAMGFVFNRIGLPAAPFLIGFILGPMFEDNLRRSLLIGANDPSIFVRGPITWFFIALTLASILFALRRYWLSRQARNSAPA